MGVLNKKQMEACCYTDGPLLILAGAGSGKTRVITHRIAYLIDDLAVNPFNILAITFTNKAAKEMRERVDKLVGYGSESIWISTFHSMCVKILRRHIQVMGMKSSFTIYDTDEQKSVIKEVVKYLKLDPKMYPERAMLSAISKAKEEYLSPERYEKLYRGDYRRTQIANIYREYQKRLTSNNALDFDDLIFKTIELFEHNPDVLAIYQERFKYIMVDEYQDTNNTQFLLVKMLADKYKNLCVVGDDDQSIYKFRGANIENILSFEEQYKDCRVIKLEQNYRSTKRILETANAVIRNNFQRKGKTLWTDNPEGEKVWFRQFDTEYDEASGVVDVIQNKLRSGVSCRDIAVLYRTNNQSRIIEEKLIMASVPYVIVGGTNFYSRKEVHDLVCYLRILNNPFDDVSLRRIINVPRRGIGDTTINKIMSFAADNGLKMFDVLADPDIVPGIGKAAAKLRSFYELIDGFMSDLDNPDVTLTELFDSILDETGYLRELELEGTDEAKGRIENLKELGNKITDYEEGTDEPTLLELLEEIALVADAGKNDDEDDSRGRVTLMTLHSAKGLEFPHVFMVGMEEGLFPSGMALNSDDMDALGEERRLCYVGITRAMEWLMLSCARQRMLNGQRMYEKRSRFIDEIPDELLQTESSNVNRSNFGTGFGSTGYSETGYRGSAYGSKTSPKSQGGGISSLSNIPGVSKGLLGGGIEPMPINYVVGDTVRHIKFGKGVVKEMVKAGNDYEVVVDFEKVGTKKVFASLARLKKL